MILVGGVMGNQESFKDNILEFDIIEQEWTEVGNMKYAAHAVGVSEVTLTDFEHACEEMTTAATTTTTTTLAGTTTTKFAV